MPQTKMTGTANAKAQYETYINHARYTDAIIMEKRVVSGAVFSQINFTAALPINTSIKNQNDELSGVRRPS